MTELQTVKALMFYLYNTSEHQVISDIYGADIHQSYRDEKTTLMQRSLAALFGELDSLHQLRFVETAMKVGKRFALETP